MSNTDRSCETFPEFPNLGEASLPLSPEQVQSMFSDSIPQPIDVSEQQIWAKYLKRVLRPAYERRWVAEWLFDGCNSSIFRNDCILPPDAFSNIIPLVINLHFQIPGTSQRISSCRASILYLPISHQEDVTVGYAFAFSHLNPDECAAAFLNPLTPPFIARFAYEHSSTDLLLVSHDTTNDTMAILGRDLSQIKIQASYTFVIESEDYGWENLPTKPKYVLRTLEYGRQNPHSDQDINIEDLSIPPGASQPSLQDLGTSVKQCTGPCCRDLYEDPFAQWMYKHDLNLNRWGHSDTVFQSNFSQPLNSSVTESNNDDVIHAIETLNAVQELTHPLPHPLHDSTPESAVVVKSRLPWRVSRNGTGADGSSWVGASSSAFDMSDISACLEDMERNVTNRSFGPERRIDEGGICPMYQMGLAVKARIIYSTANKLMGNTLSSSCAQMYYQVVLSTTADSRFTPVQSRPLRIAPANVTLPNETEVFEETTFEVEGSRQGNVCACGQINCPCANAKAAKRAKILAERKKRNRLSAARSNTRRKERLEKMKEDLKQSKAVLKDLQEKKTQVVERNQKLKEEWAKLSTTNRAEIQEL